MTARRIVENPYRLSPLFRHANETIKINNLKTCSDPKEKIKNQVKGIFLLRHQLGLENALHRVKVFNLCKKMV